jgi:hypothetical protein
MNDFDFCHISAAKVAPVIDSGAAAAAAAAAAVAASSPPGKRARSESD